MFYNFYFMLIFIFNFQSFIPENCSNWFRFGLRIAVSLNLFKNRLQKIWQSKLEESQTKLYKLMFSEFQKSLKFQLFFLILLYFEALKLFTYILMLPFLLCRCCTILDNLFTKKISKMNLSERIYLPNLYFEI